MAKVFQGSNLCLQMSIHSYEERTFFLKVKKRDLDGIENYLKI